MRYDIAGDCNHDMPGYLKSKVSVLCFTEILIKLRAYEAFAGQQPADDGFKVPGRVTVHRVAFVTKDDINLE